jgi:hypothetical protein
MACRWAVSWNTSILVRWHMPSLAASASILDHSQKHSLFFMI